ncbi:putative ribonuclease H protein, partial [Trifolium medium]|nr:putative ribonuclease H protein [Trifolium medium]
MPTKVRKKIIRIQRNFLWGGASGEKNKIPWVSWKDVCRPKVDGGLGVKDLLLFNVSLLAKWRWCLLVEDGSLWKKVLEAKYGRVGRLILPLNRRNYFSLWWKDLVCLGGALGGLGDWTQEVFVKKVGNGGATRFWLDVWVGREPLSVTFPRLFKVSLQPNLSVLDMGVWENDTWFWRLKWRRSFFAWEDELLAKLLETIESVQI